MRTILPVLLCLWVANFSAADGGDCPSASAARGCKDLGDRCDEGCKAQADQFDRAESIMCRSACLRERRRCTAKLQQDCDVRNHPRIIDESNDGNAPESSGSATKLDGGALQASGERSAS